MSEQAENRAQVGLVEQVVKRGLCTGCGACTALCPNIDHYRDVTVVLHGCDRDSGRCYDYCPRTSTRLAPLYAGQFAAAAMTPELGAVQEFHLVRAADAALRGRSQHGGTVTALLTLALSEGLLDAAVASGQSTQGWSTAQILRSAAEVLAVAGSKFVAAPNVGAFYQAAGGADRAIGVVATPCQALALAKMRAHPAPEDAARLAKLKLVIGLFCGWALGWRELTALLRRDLGDSPVRGLDVPPSRHACMEVSTDDGVVEIPIDAVERCVRGNCNYCLDLTCEFADLSVGSARSPEGWAVDRGWNQLIVRTEPGRELMQLARDRGVLEFKEMPAGNLDRLKAAARNKKRSGRAHLVRASGSEDDWLYLRGDDPALGRVE